MTTKLHAKYSASSSERWIQCPGSIKLIEKAPTPPESPYAEEGTRAHEALEFILKEAIRSKGKPFTLADGLRAKYGGEMIRHALDCLKIVHSKLSPTSQVISEAKIDLDFIIPDVFFGTLDIAIIEEFGLLTVIDYKYGAGVVVNPKKNLQLIYYALGVAHKFNYNFKAVAIGVFQPRAYHEDGPYREWVISIDELRSYIDVFKDGYHTAEEEAAILVSGSHCKFCPAGIICPEISNKALTQAKIDFAPTGEVVTGSFDFEVLTGINLGKMLDAFENIELYIEKVREHALSILKRGETIDGWKLVEKRSTRKWLDADKTLTAAKRKWGVKAFTEPELLSPAQLEKVAGKDWVNERVSNVSSGVTIARERDKREAINQIAKDFDEIPLPEIKDPPTITSRRRQNA